MASLRLQAPMASGGALAVLPVLAGRLDRCARFVHAHVRWLASLVAYVAVVLGALQTGLASDRLARSPAFQALASGCAVFALVGPLALLLAVALYVGLAVLYHGGVRWVTSREVVGKGRPEVVGKTYADV